MVIQMKQYWVFVCVEVSEVSEVSDVDNKGLWSLLTRLRRRWGQIGQGPKPGSVSKEQEQEREEGAHLCEMGSGFYSLVAGPLRSQGRVCVTRVCVTRVCEARGALAHACGVACGGRARGVLW